MNAVTLGLDGANWQMLEQWLDEGSLPNLDRLIDDGTGGVSRSHLPPLTVPNWKCYSTGKNPGKLGVFRFDTIDTANRTHVFHDSTDFASAELWDYLNDIGLETGVLNKPSTYPPREIDGFIVAGGPDASETTYRSLDDGFATPKAVETLLTDELGYRVHPSPMISPSERGEPEIQAILELIDLRFDAAELLLAEYDPDFLHMTVFYNMALQHYFWTDDPVFRAWKRIDDRLGDLRERIDEEDAHLLVMSDHGTCAVETIFYVNVWLQQRGYLSTHGNIDSVFGSIGLTKERALSIAKRLGVAEPLSTVVPDGIQRMLPWEEGIKRDRVLNAIDWEETTAVASTQGPVYLTVDRDDPEYNSIRESLRGELASLTHPVTGDPIASAVHHGETFYSGPYAANAPDLIIEQAPNVHTSDAIGPSEWYAAEGAWKGGNMPEGICLWYGPDVRDDGIALEARIHDLAPTLLHLLGSPVPTDMDGTVLDVFEPASDPGRRAVAYREPIELADSESTDSHDEVESRLADLGYLE
ncbi:MAG: alkaline phosphatase family protein [Halobacteriota archaeon]